MGEIKGKGEVKGWCPGALRPMETGDGLLVRLRLSAGILNLAQACQIADLAQSYGNGRINLSARANLQIRGVTREKYPELIAELQALKLVEGTAETEAVRNVIASPLAGERGALIDIRPVIAALEQRLGEDETCWRLPGKFGFLIDDSGSLSLENINADMRFEAVASSEGVKFGLALAGADEVWFGLWPAEAVPEIAAQVAHIFVTARDENRVLRRMHDLVAEKPVTDLAGLIGANPLPRKQKSSPALNEILGVQDGFAGVAVAFGFLDSENLHKLAQIAENLGAQNLRLTPWRSLLVTGLTPETAAMLVEQLAGSAFITDAGDPRLLVAACPGAPSCSSAQTAAAEDALALAPRLKGMQKLMLHGIMLHVSGCAKGCAHPAKAPLTLVGRNGLYDLVQSGSAKDMPLLTGLAPDQLTKTLTPLIDQLSEQFSYQAAHQDFAI